MFALVEYATQILAYDAERQQLCATKKQDDDHNGGVASDGIAVCECAEQYIYHITECKERAEQAQHCGYAQWRSGVGGDALDGQTDQATDVEG